MSDKLYLYPIWIRLWHVCNALLFLLLIITGLSMQYSSPEQPMIRFDYAVSIHNICGILLTANYLFFFIGNLVTTNGKYYKTSLRGIFDRLMIQFRYYTIGIFNGAKAPFPISKERKFNPLQQFTYVVAMYIFLPIIFISGWALLFPELLFNRLLGVSGLRINDFIHIVTSFLASIFMFVHIYFCTIGSTFISSFRSMINGYHDTHD
ncbi:MAG: cytochrome b/b6 domain-containing protein [Bacteroidales bacterium]